MKRKIWGREKKITWIKRKTGSIGKEDNVKNGKMEKEKNKITWIKKEN